MSIIEQQQAKLKAIKEYKAAKADVKRQKHITKAFNRAVRRYNKTAKSIAENNGNLTVAIGSFRGMAERVNGLWYTRLTTDLTLSPKHIEKNAAYKAFKERLAIDGYAVSNLSTTNTDRYKEDVESTYFYVTEAATAKMKIEKLQP